MPFTLTTQHLQRLCDINKFPVPNSGLIFFGLRGCLPINLSDHSFQAQHDLQVRDVDYISPRCTLAQWRPQRGDFALFPGSTVPNLQFIKKAKVNGGQGANQLMTGYYLDYRKGAHKAGKPTAHDAFRQTAAHPIRRSSDDFDFENDDRVEFSNPFDNLHAAWCQGVDATDYASAGCQVVVGFPKCQQRKPKPDIGAWKIFRDNAYNLAQNSFPYFLLTGRDAQQAVINPAGAIPVRLRYGSNDPLVSRLQTALQKESFYEGVIDTDFGERTLRAVLAYQTAVFGPKQDDGIVGPLTASTLKISGWPSA